MPTTHRYVVPSDLWKSLLTSPTAMEAIQAKALTYDGHASPALVCADYDGYELRFRSREDAPPFLEPFHVGTFPLDYSDDRILCVLDEAKVEEGGALVLTAQCGREVGPRVGRMYVPMSRVSWKQANLKASGVTAWCLGCWEEAGRPALSPSAVLKRRSEEAAPEVLMGKTNSAPTPALVHFADTRVISTPRGQNTLICGAPLTEPRTMHVEEVTCPGCKVNIAGALGLPLAVVG